MNKFDVTKSKCWSCRFGLCVSETEQEKLIHRGVSEVQDKDNFGMINDFSELEDEDEGRLLEHTVEHQSIKAICYWKPEYVRFSPPIAIAYIESCSRFEKEA